MKFASQSMLWSFVLFAALVFIGIWPLIKEQWYKRIKRDPAAVARVRKLHSLKGFY
jgi:hypothetical protein